VDASDADAGRVTGDAGPFADEASLARRGFANCSASTSGMPRAGSSGCAAMRIANRWVWTSPSVPAAPRCMPSVLRNNEPSKVPSWQA